MTAEQAKHNTEFYASNRGVAGVAFACLEAPNVVFGMFVEAAQ